MVYSIPSWRRLNPWWWGSEKWLLHDHKRIHIYRHHVVPRVKMYVPQEDFSFSEEVHRRHQNDSYILGCIVGETYWRLVERGWRKRIVRCMYRLHKIHLIERKATWWAQMVLRETYKKTNNISSRQCMARNVDACVWCSEKESKTKMGYRETKTRQCQTLERNVLYWTKRWRTQAHNQSRSEKVDSSDACSNALRNTDKEQRRKPPQYWETQRKICLYCWCRGKHETKGPRSGTQISSRSYHCKRNEFSDSLQSCSQVHSDALSIKRSGCKGSSGKRIGKT